jgi:radical SAM protein with 4Fe4S-binding SPASM domain
MRWWNRAKLLAGYWRRQSVLGGLPVEFIVETTAKCNLYCPMCPRETHKQPKEDMPDAVFEKLASDASSSAEHMMLIGLGEPFLDPKIFDRIGSCEQHGIHSLLSTNGTLLDEATCRRILDSSLAHVTLSFDGSTKESFEFYRKGAKFEKVRDNFVRLARLKAERGRGPQIVVQMVRMERNAGEVDEFIRFWSRQPGVDQVRIKEDETNLMRPDAGHAAADWKYPCHYLWRGPMYVKWNGDAYPCCQSYMLDGAPLGNVLSDGLERIWNGPAMQRMRGAHARGRGGEIDVCSRCCTTIPHPLLVTGSLVFHGATVRKLLPLVERLVYLVKIPGRWLTPPQRVAPAAPPPPELVQISSGSRVRERENAGE